MDDPRIEVDESSPGRVLNSSKKLALKNSPLPWKKQGPSIKSFPSIVEFMDVEIGSVYIITVAVQNATKRVHRFQVMHPDSPNFNIKYDHAGVIAPGLDLKIEVEFCAKENVNYHSSIIIKSEGSELEIPLHAYKPRPRFDSTNILVDLGKVVLGNTISKMIEIKNLGTISGEFKITYDPKLPITITPKSGSIAPIGHPATDTDDVCKIRVSFVGNTLGVFRAVANIVSPNQESGILNIHAVVVEHRIEFLSSTGGGILENISFGTIFFGKEKKIIGNMLNNGPLACSFSILGERNDNQENFDDTDDSVNKMYNVEKVMNVQPKEGVIPPYSEVPISFTFKPINSQSHIGFKNDKPILSIINYEMAYVIDCPDTKQVLRIPTSGKAVRPNLEISPRILQFNECPVGDRRDIMLTISNVGVELNIKFAINKVAHFKVNPSTGILLPGQNVKVCVTFYPSQIGKYSNTLHVVVDDGINIIPLKISGNAISTHLDKTNPKHARTQQKDPKFVDSDLVAKSSALVKPFTRTLPWNKVWTFSDSLKLEAGGDSDFDLTYSAEDLDRKFAHRDTYRTFLELKRKERKDGDLNTFLTKSSDGNVRLKRVKDDSIDLGLEPFGGLIPPSVPLPTYVDELWLERPLGSDGTLSGLKKKNSSSHDENRLFKKKFKPAPQTQLEARDCQVRFTNENLDHIHANSKVFNFGRICVTSVVAKCFSVANDLSQSILVAILIETPVLSKSTPRSQVIPTGCAAGFDIVLCSNVVGNLKETFTYTINGHHMFKVLVTAEIVPIEINLSVKSLKFAFGPDNLNSTITETIALSNPGNCDAEFKFSPVASGVFTVFPETKIIPAGKNIPVDVTFNPAGKGSNEDTLIMKVTGGNPEGVLIPVIGETESPKLTLNNKMLDFGLVTVGIPKMKTVTLKNTGSTAAVFWIEALPGGVSIEPSRGRVPINETVNLYVSINAESTINYEEEYALINVRSSKQIRLGIKVEALIPDVNIIQDQFVFGQVPIGANVCIPFTIKNLGNIAANLELDLNKYKDFTADFEILESLSVAGTELEGKKKESEAVRRTSSFDTASNNGDFEEEIETSVIPLDRKSTQGDEVFNEEVEKVSRFKIIIKSSSSVKVLFTFSPTHNALWAFELPVFLSGVPNYPSLRRAVTAEGVSSRILLSTNNIDFGKKIILRDAIKVLPYYENIVLSSADNKPLKWSFGTSFLSDPLYKDVFMIDHKGGILEPGKSIKFRFHFLPSVPQTYNVIVPIFLDDVMDRPYLEVTLAGIGMYPSLIFDTKEIILPTVPLNIISKKVFYISNSGYDNLELKYRLPGGSSKLPITISFPEGQTIGLAKSRLPIEISFISKKAMSFSSKIEFVDDIESKFEIIITGTADNCILTSFSFLENNALKYALIPNDKNVIQIVDLPKVAIPSSSLLNDLEIPEEKINFSPIKLHKNEKRSIDNLLKWFNINVGKSSLHSIPTDIILSHGKPVLDIIETLTGKKLPAKVNSKIAPHQFIDALITQYTEMLNFLKGHGALLHHVRPEILLNLQDYLKWCLKEETSKQKHVSTAHVLAMRHECEQTWNNLVVESWTSILYQVLKVYVLSRVTIKQFTNLPGNKEITSKNPSQFSDSELLGSNVYSSSECLLLRWINLHRHKILTPSELQAKMLVTNFDSDLENGQAIICLLLSHVPYLKSPGNPLHSFDERLLSGEEIPEPNGEQNALAILSSFEYIGLNYNLTVDDILYPNPRDMLLLLLYLYEQLPQLVPKTQIEFRGSLGQKIKKNIQLRNPSKVAITYDIEFVGDSGFSVASSTFTVEAGGQNDLELEFTSKFSKSVEGRLTLKSRKDSGLSVATMVFILKSFISGFKSICSVNVESTTYTCKNVEVIVKNPFSEDCVFNLSMIQNSEIQIPPKVIQLSALSAAKQGGNSKVGTVVKRSNSKILSQATPKSSIDAFYLKNDTLKLKAGAQVSIMVPFVPFYPGKYSCSINFLDVKVGEFVAEIKGVSGLPQITELIKLNGDLKSMINQDLWINPRNSFYESAIQVISGLTKSKSKVENMILNQEPYLIELSSPYFSSLEEIYLNDAKNTSGRTSAISKDISKNDLNLMKLTLNPKNAGIYSTRMICWGVKDVRVYDIEYVTNTLSADIVLEFNIPAGQSITQDVPIVNKTDEEWALKADFSGHSSFSGPRMLLVPAKSQSKFPVTFRPEWTGIVEGKLSLTNSKSNQKISYGLTGSGEDPLAVDHISISCKARDRISHTFVIENKTKDPITYTIESDLPNVSGESSFTIPAQSEFKYVLKIKPLLGGTYTGSITFKGSNDRYTWYTLEVNVSSPIEEQQLDIEVQVRKAVAVEISLENPLDEYVEFDVTIVGSGLEGEKHFSLGPKENSMYECIFAPLIPGTFNGSISFVNEKVGEIWYKLKCVAVECPPIILPTMVAPVGGSISQKFTIENPSNDKVTLRSKMTNLRNYTVEPALLSLSPLQSAEVNLTYTPSSLDDEEANQIVFYNAKLGSWVYYVTGIGELPSFMPITTAICNVGSATNFNFVFTNPFPERINVDIALKYNNASEDSVIKCLIKKFKGLSVDAFGNMQVPFVFTPVSITTTIVVAEVSCTSGESARGLIWKFPLHAVAEAPLNFEKFSFQCACRSSLVDFIDLKLTGLPPFEGEEIFNFHLEIPEALEEMISQFLTITPVKTKLKNNNEKLKFQINFDPLKSFYASINLIISNSHGGRWRYEIVLNVDQPPVDDTIIIESNVNQTNSISFQLINPFSPFDKFNAQFSTESPNEFSVYPINGYFDGENGVNFLISFSPTGYGKLLIGKLIIQTKNMQWTYEVKGVPPEYNPPEGKGKVNSRQGPLVQKILNDAQKPTDRNIVKENIVKIKKKRDF